MNPERWKKIEDIFQDALDLSGDEREKFIAEKTGDDDELRAEVEKLVARFEEEEEFLESPVWTDSVILGNTLKNRVASSLENEILPERAEKSFTGKRVGVYRLTDQIGKGGMGVVYAAERADGEFSQKTAVKLIKRGMDTDFIISRFRHERQILANLNHPNIARLLDGGTTDDDLPYFVMEFIEGKPLLKYAQEKNLDLRQKLKLFLQVCAPIIYAHKRKIIHRDIKPSNILVNEDGEPKLLDFGIAKLLDTDSIHESFLPTATAMRLMTPEYASPEQVRGEAITPASDQYSLGVLLYELITETRPYKFPSRSPHEIARVICEEIPSEPSSGSFGKIAARETELNFDEDFCKKLDRIILKSLRKKTSERYATVEEFAADIERFLRNENVRAESFAKEFDLSAQKQGGVEITKESAPETSENRIDGKKNKRKERAVSPRWKGIKQGIFLITISVLLLPVYLIIIVTDFIDPVISISLFLLSFFGGIGRILYSLFFESGEKEEIFDETKQTEIAEAETKLINSVAPRETIAGNINTSEKTGESEKSIAVLPFKNLNAVSGGTTDSGDFLSVGLADALITRISNVRQLVVRPTSSVLKFGAGETDSLEAGKELNVNFIVEGNIVKSEKRIRVSVQLLDVKDRSTVWAERFDEDLIDYLDLEDSISAKVVESLLPKVSGEDQKQLDKRGTENVEAYEAYLRGRYHFNFYTDEDFQKAINYYEKAVELDPKFALAHAAIADYYVWQSVYDVNPVSPKAKESALKAIALDDHLSEAYAALGLALLYGEYDWKKSEESISRAVELNPNNSVAHLWYSHCLFTQKRFPEGTRHISRALDLDPLSYLNHNTYAWSFYFQRRYDEALKLNDELLENYPKIGQAHFSRGSFLNKLGRPDEALKAMRNAQNLEPESLFVLYGLASTLAAAGQRKEVEKLIDEIKAKSKKRYFSNYQTAIVYCYLNEIDLAFEYLEKSLENRDSLLVWLAVEPSLDPIRGDARYQKLLEKITHPAAGKIDSFATREHKSNETKVEIQKKERRFPVALKYILLAVITVGLGFLIYDFVTHLHFNFSDSKADFTFTRDEQNGSWKDNFTSMMNVRRLTATGIVERAVVSPGGKRIAYISSDNQNQSLRIREIGSETEHELVAPEAVSYLDLKFSPGGKYIYYLIDRPTAPRTLYKISVEGKEPEKISEDVFNSFAISPDGKRIAYDFYNREKKNFNILVSEIEENNGFKNPQFVSELNLPAYYVGGFSFSPDGAHLMYAISKIEDSKEPMNIFTYNFETKTETQLTTKNFIDIKGGAWRSIGEEIVVCGVEENSSLYQLWLVSFPSGEVTPLTKDFYDYFEVSLTLDASTLVTVKKDSTANLWLGELSESSRDFETKTKQITNKTSRRDGIEGLNWTKDGRVVFVWSINGENNISTINADGTDEKNIPVKTVFPSHPFLTADNRFLIFSDQKDQKMNVWRFDTQTGELSEMSSRYSLTPAVSTDDKFVVYSGFSQTKKQMTLHRRSLFESDETEISSGVAVAPVVSPDGRFVASMLNGNETEGSFQIAIFPTEQTDGKPIKVLKVFQHGDSENPQTRPLAWSPNGKYLYFADNIKNASNIFRIAIEGDEKPKQMTFFTSGKIFDFALASDGKRLALSRGSISSDIIVFNKSK